MKKEVNAILNFIESETSIVVNRKRVAPPEKLINEKYINLSKKYFDKYGVICILFAWLPIIGDPITFVAGILKYNFKIFLVLVVISKLSRYLFIALII